MNHTIENAVEFRRVSKVYGTLYANKEVNFSVKKGTIHAVIGENGAGKSTAMNLLYGLTAPTSGEILVFNQKKVFSNSRDAIQSGIGMVHQHFMLSKVHSVLDNVILGAEPGFFIHRDEIRNQLEILCKKVGFSLPLDQPIESLSVGEEQRVEILKVLYRNASIIILDEPTAVLTPIEVQLLFENLKQLKADGKTIIIITHKLKEVCEIADEITVFRKGEVVGFFNAKEVNSEQLAEAMVGRKVNLPKNKSSQDSIASKNKLELLRIENGDCSISLKNGEILGIAGVEGNGQDALIESLFHLKNGIFFEGKSIGHFSIKERMKCGISLIPQDRHEEGVMLGLSVWENFILGFEDKVSRFGILNLKVLKEKFKEWTNRFNITPIGVHHSLKSLSGGNQQKWVLARALQTKPKLLIAAQPTRGVDIGAIEKIHAELLREKENGLSILLVSSELEEVLSLSDRVCVLYKGKVVSVHERHEGEFNEKKIGEEMGGVF